MLRRETRGLEAVFAAHASPVTNAGLDPPISTHLLLARNSTLRRTRSLLSGANRSSGATLPNPIAPFMHPGPPPEPSSLRSP
jgi:hypothetical protein